MSLRPVPGEYQPPGLVREPIFYADVPKKLIKTVLGRVKQVAPPLANELQHVKRVQPVPGDDSRLSVLLCPQARIGAAQLEATLADVTGAPVAVRRGFQSRYAARSKEEAAAWSQQVWPLVWRGNVRAQPPALAPADMAYALARVRAMPAAANASPCCDECWIVDAARGEAGHGTFDPRRAFSVQHSVMAAVAAVAAAHGSGDGGYLCVGMDVFCTQEPCAMCCMALVHSRIRRLFFRRDSPSRKGAIRVYCLHARAQLNHTFEAWRYEEEEPELNSELELEHEPKAGLEPEPVTAATV